MSALDLLQLANRSWIIDDYRFVEGGVYIWEGSTEYFFRHDEAELFLRGLIGWYLHSRQIHEA